MMLLILTCVGVAWAQQAAAPDPKLLQSFDRAWERIRDTYYDPTFHGIDWDAARAELRPKAAKASTVGAERAVIQELISRLGESHFEVIPRDVYGETGDDDEPAAAPSPVGAAIADDDPSTEGDLGFDTRVIDGAIVVTRVEKGAPADLAGLRCGWILHSLDDANFNAVARQVHSSMKDASLAEVTLVHEVRRAQLGTPGSVAKLVVSHGRCQSATLEIERRKYPGIMNRLGNLPPLPVETEARMLPGGIGYFRFNIFLTPVADPYFRAMSDFKARGAKGVIVDVRGNPGGIGAMVMGMAGCLISKPDVVLGSLRLRGTALRFVAIPQAEPRCFAGPVAVLVDELSMSTSEIFAAGLQGTGRARVFGTRTAGMALPSVVEELPDGDRLQFVMADLTGPGGVRIEGRGVTPDVVVPSTRAGLAAGGDPVLAAARKWIARQK